MVRDSCLWDSGRWEGWKIILELTPPLLSRHLTLHLRNINFLLDFSIFDALDACLMVHGSWLKAHGSWPREARGGSWLMARGRPGPGDPEARGPGPGRKRNAGGSGVLFRPLAHYTFKMH